MSDISSLLRLDGAILRKLDASVWGPEGTIQLLDCRLDEESVRLELRVPTEASDRNDFIWRRELEQQTTDKFVLLQDGRALHGARVIGIAREGHLFTSDDDAHAYRLVFTVAAHELILGGSVMLQTRDQEGKIIARTA
jgi:hypothetical protein